jgi:hypothetical protein
MTVAFETLSGDSPYGLDRPELGLAWSTEMNGLDRADLLEQLVL